MQSNEAMHYIIIFLPSVTFGSIPSEIFPWVLFLFLFGMRSDNWRVAVLFLLIAMTATVLPAILNGFDGFLVIKSIISYLNALMAYFLIKNSKIKQEKFVNILVVVLLLEVGVGVLQYLSVGNMLWDLMLPRYLYGSEAERGSSGLSPEPAMQAINLILILSTLMSINNSASGIGSKVILMSYAIMPIYLFFINKSATGVLLMIVLFLVRIALTSGKFTSILFLFFVLLVLMNSLPLIQNNRSVEVFVGILDGSNLFQVLSVFGGFRFQTVFAGYWDPSIFGWGLGNWTLGLLENIKSSEFLNSISTYYALEGIESGVRPMSFFSSVILEGGLILLLLILCLLKNGIRELWRHKLPFIMIGISLLFLGHTGSPIPFGLMGVLYLSRETLQKSAEAAGIRRLKKNNAQLFTLFAFSNLWMSRKGSLQNQQP